MKRVLEIFNLLGHLTLGSEYLKEVNEDEGLIGHDFSFTLDLKYNN